MYRYTLGTFLIFARNLNEAMARRKKQDDETLVDIVEVRDSAKSFFEKNQNLILGVLAGIILIVGGYVLYENLYKAPKEKDAAQQMFQAQFQFEQDSFAAALTNPGGGYDGFLDIIDNYSGTNAANIAHYYAAVSYLNLGQFDDALDHINDFSAGGEVMPIMKAGVKGDIFSEQGDLDKAISSYKKAASYENDFLAPFYMQKLALLQEKQGLTEDALEQFKMIKQKYPESQAAREVEKFIARLES